MNVKMEHLVVLMLTARTTMAVSSVNVTLAGILALQELITQLFLVNSSRKFSTFSTLGVTE